MKEQDAAHSFEKEKIESLELENERLKQAYKYIHASRNSVDEELNEANKELTRLRSELQQKDEVIKELIPIAQWKLDSTQNYLYDFRVSKEDDPDKFAEVERLQSLLQKLND